jgi:hypothetical protein
MPFSFCDMWLVLRDMRTVKTMTSSRYPQGGFLPLLWRVILILSLCCCANSLVLAQQTRSADPSNAEGESIRIATYNVENWRWSFEAFKLSRRVKDNPDWPPEFIELIDRSRREDDEENWEVARVILDPSMRPDVLLIQESCSQSDLNYFNTQFLDGFFEYIHVFKTNTGRNQHLAVMARRGLRVVEVREDYHQTPDEPDVNTNSDRLFARGPGFVLFETPGGRRIWVGTNHQKSRGFNREAGETGVTSAKWRGAESDETHRIIQSLRRAGPAEVVFAADVHDELGVQEFESEAGGSALERLAGSGPDALVVATRSLAESGQITFHGQRSSRYKSFIDHVLLTPEAARWMTDIRVVTGPMADVASDHYPVVVDLKLE